MNNKLKSEEIELFEQAKAEIKILRHQNQIMSARLEMFDSMSLIFNTVPNIKQEGYCPDIVSIIAG